MFYCINYHPKLTAAMKEADEIKIIYNKRDNTLCDYLRANKDKHIIIKIIDCKDFYESKQLAIFKALKKSDASLDNYSFELSTISEELFIAIQELGIPVFYTIPATDWDIFWGFINLGVSQIFIAENLGFEIQQAAEIAHKKGIAIRVYPNVCQSSWTDTPSIKTFFIRPEDLKTYEPYVDTIEFYTTQLERQTTLLKIYKKDQRWFGNLGELIIGFKDEVDSRSLIEAFPVKRTKCGKKCFKGAGCAMCDRAVDLAKTMSENQLMFTSIQKN